MPLNTVLLRDNKPTVNYGYSAWHICRIADAMDDEAVIDDSMTAEVGKTDWFPYGYVFRKAHSFTELETNIWDRGGTPGAYFTLDIQPGDVYNCWRSTY